MTARRRPRKAARRTKRQASDVKAAAAAAPPALAYDTETTGLSVHAGYRMFAYSTSTEDWKLDVVRLDGSPSRQKAGRAALEEVWSHPERPVVFHNSKFDLKHTEAYLGRSVEGQAFHDTMAMSHMLQNRHPSHALKQLTWELAGYPRDDEAAVKRYTRAGRVDYSIVPEHLMDLYQRRDAERTMLLYRFFLPKLEARPKLMACYRKELELVRTTMRMECRGVMIDQDACRAFAHELEGMAGDELRKLQEIKPGLNPDSPDHLASFLYSKLRLPVMGRTATRKPSTRKDYLLRLREHHPAVDMVLKYRSWSKGATTMLKYLELADEEGVLYPDIRTNGAKATGRESCSNPNLQNVAKGHVLKNPFAVPARKVFRPRPGYVNVHLDYAGIEMRLLIHASGDPEMTRILQDGNDPHHEAAKIFYGDRFLQTLLDDPDFAKELRDASKNANYAIPYGAAFRKVSRVLTLSEAEAKVAYAMYKRTFPGLVELSRATSNEVREHGCVETHFGRQLSVPRNQAYKGVNYRTQGEGAGVVKRAQVRVDKYLRDATSDEAGLLLPIHDEIVLEWPEARISELPGGLRDIRALMIDFDFRVPMDITAKVSRTNWEDAKVVKILRKAG